MPIDDHLRIIAASIVNENKSLEEWSDCESDDMFHRGRFAGGFDADEREFCFSFHGTDGEFWFQLSLAQIKSIADGEILSITGRPAE